MKDAFTLTTMVPRAPGRHSEAFSFSADRRPGGVSLIRCSRDRVEDLRVALERVDRRQPGLDVVTGPRQGLLEQLDLVDVSRPVAPAGSQSRRDHRRELAGRHRQLGRLHPGKTTRCLSSRERILVGDIYDNQPALLELVGDVPPWRRASTSPLAGPRRGPWP